MITTIKSVKTSIKQGWKTFWRFTPITEFGEYNGFLLEPKSLYLLQKGKYFTYQEILPGDTEKVLQSFMVGALRERWSARRTKELVKVEKMAEIGVQFGDNSYLMYKYLEPKEMVLVDSYQEVPDRYNGLTTCETSMEIAHDMLGEWVKADLKWFREPSQTAFKHFPDEYFDFVYIDGDHDYEPVKQDIEGWYPKVRKGGVLAGDDYAPRYPGVMQAVDELFPGREQEDREWLVWKQ